MNPQNTIEALYNKISQHIESSRNNMYRAANHAMVQAYWDIGKLIVEEEQKGKERAKYGQSLLKELSKRLTAQYGKSFGDRNLRHIRQFYLTFSNWNAVRTELSWTHYRLLLKVEKEEARHYYLEEAVTGNWSTRTLERQINSLYYERILATPTAKRVLVKQELEEKKEELHPSQFIKDPYVLEFAGLKPNTVFYEKELEEGLINRLQEFLLELGKGFSFVGRQHRISFEGEHFYIDLVFYNFILKCFLLIDLKNRKVDPSRYWPNGYPCSFF